MTSSLPERDDLRRIDLPVIGSGGRLTVAAWVPSDPRGVAVLLHGIPSIAPPDLDDRGYEGMAHDLARRGWLAVWGDMRSTRRSAGYFSIEGWVSDARAIVDAARSVEEASGKRLVLLGSSAGGAVAAEATRRGAPVDALVLLGAPATWASFAAGPSVGAERIQRDSGMQLSPESLADLPTWAAEFDAVTTQDAIGWVKVPTLIVHGTADSVVPVDHARLISERAPSADLRIIEGAGHQLRREPAALDTVLDWLDNVL